jgi:hypothetical protein
MEGRTSHLKTTWYAPWVAGWQNLRVFFLFRPDFFLRLPGRVLSALGALLVFGLAFGPVQLGPVTLALYTQVLGLFLLGLGSSFTSLDALTTTYLKFDKPRIRRLRRFYDYDVVAPVSAVCILAGAVVSGRFVINWIDDGFKIHHLSHGFIVGLGLAMLGFQAFLKSLTITLFMFGRPSDE